MRLRVLSDLHTELEPCTPGPGPADLVVLAGDIGVGAIALDWIREAFPDTPAVFVAGNHEFYTASLPDGIDEFRARASQLGIHFLENDAIVLGGVRFAGCTLWTDFSLRGSANLARDLDAARLLVNDYHQIGKSGSCEKLQPEDTLALHRQSRAFLEAVLAQPFAGPTVVVTHHAPSARSIPGFALARPAVPALSSDLEPLIEACGPALWLHGHTHWCADYTLHRTRILSNQKGYPHARVPGFAPGRVIEI